MGKMICINGEFLPFGLKKCLCNFFLNNSIDVIRF